MSSLLELLEDHEQMIYDKDLQEIVMARRVLQQARCQLQVKLTMDRKLRIKFDSPREAKAFLEAIEIACRELQLRTTELALDAEKTQEI